MARCCIRSAEVIVIDEGDSACNLKVTDPWFAVSLGKRACGRAVYPGASQYDSILCVLFTENRSDLDGHTIRC